MSAAPRATARHATASLWAGGGLLLGAACLAGLALGAIVVPPSQVSAILAGAMGAPTPTPADPVFAQVVLELRLPRVLLAALVGASLGTSGALVQGWFRNPLAEPGLVGVSGGAALGASLAILYGGLAGLGALSVPASAFVGALLAVVLVHTLGVAGGRAHAASQLLAGLGVNALAGAGTGLLLTLADNTALRNLTFWTLGSLGAASWPLLAWMAPVLALGLIAAWPLARDLDGLLLGERAATHLGIDTARTQRRVAVVVAWLVGTSVAVTGLIGFIGLVAPHLVRLIAGPRHRIVVPGSALAGAVLLELADVVSRTIAAPVELPIGAITTLLGGPVFLALLARPSTRLT